MFARRVNKRITTVKLTYIIKNNITQSSNVGAHEKGAKEKIAILEHRVKGLRKNT